MEDKTKEPEILKLLRSESVKIEGKNGITYTCLLIDDAYKVCLDIVKQPEPSTESVPSAEAFLTMHPDLEHTKLSDLLEGFASLCVEQARKEWEKEIGECKCTVDDRIGTTKLWCCNICGKRTENF